MALRSRSRSARSRAGQTSDVRLAAAEAAAAAVDGEVIVTDGGALAASFLNDLASTTHWHTEPGRTVFQLRALAYRFARAPIVAITEDHCRVPPDWAQKMLYAHASHPEAVAVGGSVENGATRNALDWASEVVVEAPIAAPIRSGPSAKLAGAVNVAYKRSAVERIDYFDGLGMLDVIHQRQLKQSGQLLIADDLIRVTHDQSLRDPRHAMPFITTRVARSLAFSANGWTGWPGSVWRAYR